MFENIDNSLSNHQTTNNLSGLGALGVLKTDTACIVHPNSYCGTCVLMIGCVFM